MPPGVDIVFKFVSLHDPRPVRQPTPSSTPRPQPVEAQGFLFARQFRARAESAINTGVPPREALEVVARAFLQSDEYAFRDTALRPLLAIEGDVHAALADLPPGEPEPWRSEVGRLLEPIVGAPFSLKDFVASDEFEEQHRTLWFSYFSLILLPRLRQGDRRKLVFWIRFFRLMEHVALGGQPIAIDNVRVIVPAHLAPEGQAVVASLSATADREVAQRNARSEEVKRLRDQIRELTTIHRNLIIRRSEVSPRRSIAVAASETGDETTTPASRKTPRPQIRPEPQLTESERYLLEEQAIAVDGQTREAIAEAIADRVNALRGRVYKAQRRDVFILRDGVLVRRRVYSRLKETAR